MRHSDDHLKAPLHSLLAPAAANASHPVDLWSLLPRELAEQFRPGVPAVTAAILREIQHTIPALGRRAGGAFERSVVDGIQQAVLQFIDRLADPAAPRESRAQVFRELSLHELSDGPILDVLQMAYRVGARVAWRHMARTATRAGVSTATLCLLAEATFAYVDELSALSIEGHASRHAREVGVFERRRRQLLEIILSTSASFPDPAVIAGLADAARWPVPDTVIAVALQRRAGATPPSPLEHCRLELPAPPLDYRVLVDLEGSEPCLLIAESDRTLLGQFTDYLPGWRAAAGPDVRLADAHLSLRWARRMVLLVQRGVLPDAAVTWFSDHMSMLWLLNNPFLVTEISQRALAPLADLTGTQRAKLGETLLASLETRRSAAEIGLMLDIHPQTVRYRLRQLARLFGDRLDDPDARFDIEVALRARRSLQLGGDLSNCDLA